MNSYREWDNKAKLVVGWISHKEQINYDNFKQANGQSRIISVYDGIRQYDHTQITSKGNKLARRQPVKEPLEIDQYVGNQGIAPESDLVIVNWEKNRFYPSDAIRAIRFIIDQTRAVEGNVVIYFPFPIKNQQQRKLIQSIVGDQRLNRQIMMVNNRDQLAHLICPTPLLENARTVEYAYEFAQEDDVIDVFIIYNSFNIEPIITTPDQTNLYPLVFPYLGARGTAREIKQLINDYLGQMVIWAGFGDRLMVSLMTPKVEGEVGEISLNKPQTYSLPGTSFVWVQGSKIDVDTGCQVIRFRFNDPVAGEWTIGIKGVVVLTGQYNIWLPKTGMILPETILSPADPFTTIYSTSAADLITVGCYDEMSQSSTASSGRGLTRDNRIKPDFMVNSVNVLGPMLDNKWGLMTGTSTASAIATGVAALIYEEQIKQAIELANTTAMRTILVANVDREATIDYPNPSIGYGLLDINQPFIIKDVTG